MKLELKFIIIDIINIKLCKILFYFDILEEIIVLIFKKYIYKKYILWYECVLLN